jgi:hypothetical protein
MTASSGVVKVWNSRHEFISRVLKKCVSTAGLQGLPSKTSPLYSLPGDSGNESPFGDLKEAEPYDRSGPDAPF